MEQPGVVVAKFGLSFSLQFLFIFVHISGSIRLITGHHWKDLLLLQKLSIDDANFGQKWWRQKWKKGQGSSRPVTAGMGVNGLKWYYDQIFTPWFFLSVSHTCRVPWKNENAIYRLQISALVPEIFKFEKWVKYANEMTDDVIHPTQYYIKHGATLANLQCTEHWNLAGW